MATKKRPAARRKASAKDDDNTGLVNVRLDDETWRNRSFELASELKRLEHTRAKKKAAVQKLNADIKLHLERIEVLAEEVDTRSAMVDAQLAMEFPTGKRERSEADDARAAAAEAAAEVARDEAADVLDAVDAVLDAADADPGAEDDPADVPHLAPEPPNGVRARLRRVGGKEATA